MTIRKNNVQLVKTVEQLFNIPLKDGRDQTRAKNTVIIRL